MAALDFPDTPTVGQIFDKWSWNGSVWVLVGGGSGGSGGGSGFTFSQDTPPVATTVGQTWYETDTGDCFVWTNDGSSSQWVEFAPGGGSGFTFVSDTAPTALQIGDTWFDNSTGVMGGTAWVAIDEGTGELVWVQYAPGVAAGTSAARGIVQMGSFNGSSQTCPAATTTMVTTQMSAFTATGRRYRVHFQIRAVLSSGATTYIRGPILYLNNVAILSAQPLYHIPGSVYTTMMYHWVFAGSGTTRTIDVRLLPDAVSLTIYHEPEIAFFYLEDVGAI